MSKDLNLITLIGRLVKDPEIKYTSAGTPVTKFSIANNVNYVQNNERQDYVNYFDINVWGNQAINCEKYLKKGSQVAITGNLRQNRWTDNASGQIKSKVEITALSVQFLSSAAGPSQQAGYSSKQGKPAENKGPENYDMITDPWGNEKSDSNGMDDQFVEHEFTDNDIPF